jgi:hypothetical protein
MGKMKRIIEVFTRPKKLFVDIRKEKDVISAIVYLAILASFYTIMKMIVSMPGALQRRIELGLTADPIIAYIMIFIISLVLFIIIVSILADILHMIIKIANGQKDYYATYNAVIYGLTPYLIFGWIPYVSIIAIIYSIILQIVGLSEVHTISKGKAATSYTILAVLIIAIIAALIGLKII